jgi:hypothetical protein
LSAPVRKSAPSVHLLKTNLMSKADLSAASTCASFSSVKPRARSVVVLIDGACLRLA